MENNKKWLWISLGMFVVPEVLWSPIVNFIYGIFQNSNHFQALRPNFLIDSDNLILFLTVISIQSIGLILSVIFVKKLNIHPFLKIIAILLLIILLIVTGFVFFTAYSMRNGIGF